MDRSDHIRNIALDVVLSVITCGLYYLYWHYKELQAVNDMLEEPQFSFVKWYLLTLVTCGLWHVYHQYVLSQAVATVMGREESSDPLIALLLSIFGLSVVADAIRQNQINEFYRG